MNRFLLFFVSITGGLMAEDKAPPLSQAVFTISGVECGSCLYMTQYALSQTAGVKEVEMVQTVCDFALVSYDAKVVTEQQMVQALREAPGLHGQPYIASMRLRIPGYTKASTAAQVKTLAKRWEQWIDVVGIDENEDEVQIQFRELKKDAKGQLPRGWTLEEFRVALKKDLGIDCEVVKPAQ